jgi:hypothetical protein
LTWKLRREGISDTMLKSSSKCIQIGKEKYSLTLFSTSWSCYNQNLIFFYKYQQDDEFRIRLEVITRFGSNSGISHRLKQV